MVTYFKAVRPDGGSFNDPSFAWATEPGGVTTHPLYGKTQRAKAEGAAGYLSVATVATDCTGFRWPCRLLVVEPVGRVWTPDRYALPSKRAGLRWRTVQELPAHEAFGPQGVQIAALLDRAARLTGDDMQRLHTAWDAAWNAVWDEAQDAAWNAAWNAVWVAARVAARDAGARAAALVAARAAARDAALGLLARDLIEVDHYDTLTGPWRSAIGPIHPDDPTVEA